MFQPSLVGKFQWRYFSLLLWGNFNKDISAISCGEISVKVAIFCWDWEISMKIFQPSLVGKLQWRYFSHLWQGDQTLPLVQLSQLMHVCVCVRACCRTDPDYPTQPPMLTFKLFLTQQDDTIGEEEAIKKYNEYKLDFKRQQISEFFLSHKEEEWWEPRFGLGVLWGGGGGGVESGREGWWLDRTFIVGGWPTGAWWNIIVEGYVCAWMGKRGLWLDVPWGKEVGMGAWWKILPGWVVVAACWTWRVCWVHSVGWGGEGGRRACSVERWGCRWIECWPGLSPLSRVDNTCSKVCRMYRKKASSVSKSWHQL